MECYTLIDKEDMAVYFLSEDAQVSEELRNRFAEVMLEWDVLQVELQEMYEAN